MQKTSWKQILLILAVLGLCALRFAFKNADAEDVQQEAKEITSVAQLNSGEYTVGFITGTSAMYAVEEELPEARQKNYDDPVMGYLSVQEGKIDAFSYDRKQMELAIENGQEGVRIMDENLGPNTDIAAGLSPVSEIPDLEEQIDRFIDELNEQGILDEMYDRWVMQGNEEMPADVRTAENPELVLTVGTSGTVVPYSYYKDGELTGFDIEFSKRFAYWLNAELEFKVYTYDAIVPAALTGDVDIICANLNVTEERLEAMAFSKPLFVQENAVMVLDTGAGEAEQGFLASVKESFEKTFIREDRYKLFLRGIGMTMFITVLSIIAGTVVGFLAYMGCRKGNPIANRFVGLTIWLVQGMPLVVLLMILYYIVFANAPIGGAWVAIIAFTLTFGATMYRMLQMGVNAVDNGQTEASLALGFSERETFFTVILPQAAEHFMPTYKGEVTALIKATAVVGYIAVQDLTKVGDIVRSRTYEAFFPLIAVAVIYFILAGILNAIVNRAVASVDPRLRKKEEILKGISCHD